MSQQIPKDNWEAELWDRDKQEQLWRDRYEKQREMEKTTNWRFCPWCGNRLAVYPAGHICGYSDID